VIIFPGSRCCSTINPAGAEEPIVRIKTISVPDEVLYLPVTGSSQ
jgi:hypothetical protein